MNKLNESEDKLVSKDGKMVMRVMKALGDWNVACSYEGRVKPNMVYDAGNGDGAKEDAIKTMGSMMNSYNQNGLVESKLTESQAYARRLAGISGSKVSLNEGILDIPKAILGLPGRIKKYVTEFPAFTRGRRAADRDPKAYPEIDRLWKAYEKAEAAADKAYKQDDKNAADAKAAIRTAKDTIRSSEKFALGGAAEDAAEVPFKAWAAACVKLGKELKTQSVNEAAGDEDLVICLVSVDRGGIEVQDRKKASTSDLVKTAKQVEGELIQDTKKDGSYAPDLIGGIDYRSSPYGKVAVIGAGDEAAIVVMPTTFSNKDFEHWFKLIW